MGNKVKIDVKIIHYVQGQSIQGVGDDVEGYLNIEPFYIDKNLLNGQILSLSAINDYCREIDNYCRKVAGNMVPYDTNKEGYILQFYHDDELISSALLNNYSDFLGRNINVEIIE